MHIGQKGGTLAGAHYKQRATKRQAQHIGVSDLLHSYNTSLSTRDAQMRQSADQRTGKKHIKVTLPDNEDESNDDQQIPEKNPRSENYFLKIFAATLPQHASEGLPRTSPIHFHFLYSSARRHIALRVLLI